MRSRHTWLFAFAAVFLLGGLTAVVAHARPGVAPSLPAGAVAQVTPAPAGSDGRTIYVVKRGDTLAAIARRYGVGLWELAAANAIINPDRIYIGQVLRIPLPRGATPTPTRTPCPCEEIVILSPAPASIVTNPVIVSGIASSPFEQTVVVAVLDGSGKEIGVVPGTIMGEYGEPGPFSVTVPFAVPDDDQPGRIQVYTESPRDGAMAHLSSVTIQLQGLGLNTLLQKLEPAIPAGDSAVLQSLMGPVFSLGRYEAAWTKLSPAQAAEQLRAAYAPTTAPRLDFSVDAAALIRDRVTLPSDVVHVVLSQGWGPNSDDDAFLLIGVVDGRARWIGAWYVPHRLITHR